MPLVESPLRGKASFVLNIEQLGRFYKVPLNDGFTSAPFIAPSSWQCDAKAMLAPLILAAALSGAPPAAEAASPYRRIEQGVVVQVSPRPAAGSGVFAVYADFEVATPTGERLRMYVLWMGGSQYLPDVGAVCRIIYRHEPLLRGNLHNPRARPGRPEGPLNVVHELSCGPPLALPGAGQRRPSAS